MLNKVILVGRLTADPQMRQTPNGVSMCRFSVAVDRPFASRETGQREADFINIVAWRQTAEFVGRYFTKGRVIVIEGSLRNNNYTDNNGVKHYSMDVLADNVSFGGDSRPNSNGQMNQGMNSFNSNQNYSGNNFGGNDFQNNNNFSEMNNSNGNFSSGQSNYNNSQSSQQTNDLEIGDLSDFEDVISDGDVPF